MITKDWPVIIVSCALRYTQDWDGELSVAQPRTSYQYCESVFKAGGIPLIAPSYTGDGPVHVEGRGWPQMLPRQVTPLRARAGEVISKAGGLLLTGGGDVILGDEDGLDDVREMDRDRDFWEAALYLEAVKARKPVFGICRGLQLINKLLGGTLWNDIPSEYPAPLVHQQRTPRTETSHKVELVEGSLIRSICGAPVIDVNSGHHQAVKDPAEGLVVTGRSPDGLIEAMESPVEPFMLAVQWHPESLTPFDKRSLALFEAFVAEARKACGL